MRRVLLALVFASVPSVARAECPRTADAITLANKADREMATNIDDAIADLVRATALAPQNHAIFGKLARAYLKKEDWRSAAGAAQSAAALAPTFATYHWLRGYALVRAESWAEAKTSLEAAISADPNLADAHFDLASALEHLHDERGALDHYTGAVRAAPDHVAFFVPLADLYRRLGYVDLALAVVREGVTWAGADANARFGLLTLSGALLERQHKLAEATTQYEEAKRACGACDEHGQAFAFFNLGAAYAQAKPARRSEAASNLLSFQKRICKGAAAARYADECTEAQELLQRVGGP